MVSKANVVVRRSSAKKSKANGCEAPHTSEARWPYWEQRNERVELTRAEPGMWRVDDAWRVCTSVGPSFYRACAMIRREGFGSAVVTRQQCFDTYLLEARPGVELDWAPLDDGRCP